MSRGAPAEDAAGVGVDHEGDVDHPRARRAVGEIDYPEPVRGQDIEVPVDQIRRPGRGRVTNRGPPAPATANPLQSLGFHQPLDGAPHDGDPFTVERQPYLPGTVDTVVLDMDAGDQRSQPLIADRLLRRRAVRRLVVRGRGDLAAVLSQYGADRLDTPDQPAADSAGPVLAGQPHQRLCSRPARPQRKTTPPSETHWPGATPRSPASAA